jgi:hypothetical protein
MVVNTRTLSGDTADQDLEKAVQYAGIAGERDKTRMVCAILHKKHYDLGVLHTAQGVQAVFQVGAEWDMPYGSSSNLSKLSYRWRGGLRVFYAPAGSRERRRVRRKCVLISVAQEQGAHAHKSSLLSKEKAH